MKTCIALFGLTSIAALAGSVAFGADDNVARARRRILDALPTIDDAAGREKVLQACGDTTYVVLREVLRSPDKYDRLQVQAAIGYVSRSSLPDRRDIIAPLLLSRDPSLRRRARVRSTPLVLRLTCRCSPFSFTIRMRTCGTQQSSSLGKFGETCAAVDAIDVWRAHAQAADEHRALQDKWITGHEARKVAETIIAIRDRMSKKERTQSRKRAGKGDSHQIRAIRAD